MSTNDNNKQPFFPAGKHIDDLLQALSFVPNTTDLVAEPRGFSYACIPSSIVFDYFSPVGQPPQNDYTVTPGKAVLCAGNSIEDGFIAAPDFRLETVENKPPTFRKLGDLRPDADLRAAFMAGAAASRRRTYGDGFEIIAVERIRPVAVYGCIANDTEMVFGLTAQGYRRTAPGMWVVGDYDAPPDPSNIWLLSDRLFNLQFAKLGQQKIGWQLLPLP